MARERGASTSWHLIASPLGTVQAATFNYTRPIGTTIGEPVGLVNVNFDPRSLDTYAWKIDEPITVQHARQIEYPTVDRTHKGDRLPMSNVAPAPAAPASLPQLQPVSAPAAPAVPPASPPPGATPQPSKSDQHAQASDAAPLVVQTDIHHDVSTAMAPAAVAADDDLIAVDRPSDSAAPGDGDDASSLEEMSFLDDDSR